MLKDKQVRQRAILSGLTKKEKHIMHVRKHASLSEQKENGDAVLETRKGLSIFTGVMSVSQLTNSPTSTTY